VLAGDGHGLGEVDLLPARSCFRSEGGSSQQGPRAAPQVAHMRAGVGSALIESNTSNVAVDVRTKRNSSSTGESGPASTFVGVAVTGQIVQGHGCGAAVRVMPVPGACRLPLSSTARLWTLRVPLFANVAVYNSNSPDRLRDARFVLRPARPQPRQPHRRRSRRPCQK